MSVRTWAGRFSIVEGQVREEGPWLGAFAHRPPDDEERTLHVLVEPALPGSEDICGQLVEVMGRLFPRENLSLTGALLRSLAAAHQNLRDWNRKSLRQNQVGAGASCLVLRGRTAYLAQVGPSLAFFFRQGELTRLTPQESWAQGPLGLPDDLRPELATFRLDPGDLLLLVSSRLSAVADQATLAGVLGRGADDALAELYLLTRDFANFSALLLSCFEEPDLVPEAAGAPPSPPGPSGGGPSVTDPRALPTLEEDTGRGGPTTALLAPPPPLPERPRPSLKGLGPDANRRRNDGNGRQDAPDLPQAVASPIQSRPEILARPVVRLRGPETVPRYRFQRTTTPRLRRLVLPRPWLLLAAAVAFVGLLAVCTIARPSTSDDVGRFRAVLEEANAAHETALVTENPDQRRTLLTGVLAHLDEAEEIRPNDEEVAALRDAVRANLAALDAVVDLGELDLLAGLGPLVSGPLDPQRLVLGGGSLFLLDGAGGRVLELRLEEVEAVAGGREVRTVLQEGELAGAVKAARPRLILWSDGGESGGTLLILDEERHLFGYKPGGTAVPLVLRGADQLGSVDGAAAYAGNLYLLDIASGQVWRYLPTDSGFDSERSGLLADMDLEGATELALDGDLYLLTEEGRIRRFVDGQEQPFAMAGIDRALLGPASLTRYGAEGLLVADRGNKRLVAFDAEGRFLRQLVSASFIDLRSAAVDSEAGRLYVLVGDSVFATDLPSP